MEVKYMSDTKYQTLITIVLLLLEQQKSNNKLKNNELLNLVSDILSFIFGFTIEFQLFINATFLIPSTK